MLSATWLVVLALAVGQDDADVWFEAERAAAGPRRVELLLQAVAATPELPSERLFYVWNTAVSEARALRLAGGTLPLQEALHERYRAAWSASDLAQTLTLLGRVQEADQLLAAAIAAEEAAGRPVAELWSRRGLAAVGIGDVRRARDYLGRALVGGSTNAGLILAWLDLQQGRLAAARGGFRSSILSAQPSAWALRGWGSTLLPPAHSAPDPGTRFEDKAR